MIKLDDLIGDRELLDRKGKQTDEKRQFDAERFATALLQCGLLRAKAYTQTFGSTKFPQENARRYVKHPVVIAAIQEELAAYREHAGSGKGKGQGILWEQIHANLFDFFDEGGTLTISEIKELPLGLQRCVKKVQLVKHTDKDGNKEERVTVELHDKQTAMTILGRIGKWFAENDDRGDEVPIADVIANKQYAEKQKAGFLEGTCERIDSDENVVH